MTAVVLVDLFGGCRESTACGRHRDRDGNVIVEEVAVVTGYGKAEDYAGKRQRFLEWLIDAKARWGQESIGFEFERRPLVPVAGRPRGSERGVVLNLEVPSS